MDLGDFNIKNDLSEKTTIGKSINEFAKELSNYLQKMNNTNDVHTSQLEEDKLYVISDIRNNEINVVDIDNGNEIKVYISTNNKNSEKIKQNSNFSEIYKMERTEFLNLNITDNIIMKDNRLYINHDKIEIKNNLAWRLLSDLYLGEKETEGKSYKVENINNNNIYLTNADGTGGYFSIHRELYPDFKIGDIVQKNDRKYNKMEVDKNELSNYLAKGNNENKYNSYWYYESFMEDSVSAKVGISRWGNNITYHDELNKIVDDSILELANKEGTLYRKKYIWNGSNNNGFYNVDKFENGQITNITIPRDIIPSELEYKDLIFQYTNKGTIKIRDDIKEKTISLASQKAEKLRDKEQERNVEFKKEGHIYETFEDDGYIFLNDLTEERDFSIEDIDFVVDNYEGDGKYQVINGEYKKITIE